MTRAIYIPGANLTAQWYVEEYRGVTMPDIDKLLLHTTETGGWPGYRGGATAPTATYHPGLHQWRQHFPLNMSARALRDPSGTVVRENRDNVVQVEIICSCDAAFARRYGYPHVTQLDGQALDDIGEFAAFLHREWGLPLVKAPVWLPYPKSYGDSPARMSGSEYDRFQGICGHMHASGNSHGDPGALDVDHVLDTAARIIGTAARDVTVSMAALNMAARGEPQSHSWWYDAKQFMAFAHKGVKVIPATTFWAWHRAPFGAWRAKLFTYSIKCVQARARVPQTGRFDDATAAYMRRFGYRVNP